MCLKNISVIVTHKLTDSMKIPGFGAFLWSLPPNLTVMSLVAGSEILTSLPSTARWPLDMLEPATAVYSPASDRRTEGRTRRCTNWSDVILYL